MRRFLLTLSTAVVIWLSGAQILWAQAAEYPLADGWSGPGFYLGTMKILTFWAIFLLWVYTTDWVSRDTQVANMDYLRWNPVVFGAFLGAFVLAWVIPLFWVNLVLLLAAYVTPLTIYIVKRNAPLAPSDRVLTREHLRRWFAERVKRVGVKVQTEAGDPHESGPPAVLTSRGGSERDNNIRLLSARQSPGFRDARQIVADALEQRADAFMLDYAQQAVGVRYLVDGVWLDGLPRDRESSDPALESLKILCGMNPQDRKSRQEAGFSVEHRVGPKPEKISATMVTQGTPTGERVIVNFERKKSTFSTLEELGMRQKMQEQLTEVLARHSGFVLLSALPANGLRTTTNVVLRGMDRFLREFAGLEDESNRYDPVENVPITTYKPSEKHNLEELLDDLFHREPAVVVIRDLVDAKMVGMMFQQIVENNRLFVSTMRGRDATDALLRLLALKVPAADVAKNVTAVLNGRLIRRLCDACKEPYVPTPEILRQLQIPEGKINALFRPPQPNPEDPKQQPCRMCQGVGYRGRTAIFELLLMEDGVRKALAANAKPDVIRQAARKTGMRTLQEEGIVLVARGVTSLPELTRVLKQ